MSRRRAAAARPTPLTPAAPAERTPFERAAPWRVRALPVLVAAVTLIVFLPALQAGFVAWDDDKNFLANPHYRGLGLEQLRWMWTTFHLGHYVPLTWMSLGADYLLWGMDPFGYHLTNVVLHAGNAVLVYFLALRVMRLGGIGTTPSERPALTVSAAVAALLFAIHPLRVESVAWVTERRDVLSGLFYLIALHCYLEAQVRRPAHHRRWYAIALASFVCALLSKATAVTLPAVLLILDVFPLSRLGGAAGWWTSRARRVYLELAPFAALSTATAVLSIVALRPPAQLSTVGKLAVSAYSLVFYLWKTVAPRHLSPVYEMPQHVDPLSPRYVISAGIVLGLATVVVAVRRRWPGVAAGALAFAVIILPMLGIVQNGPQIAADRYTYHAAPALTILAAAGYALLIRRGRPLGASAREAVVAVVLLVLATLTWRQTRVWRDSTALWTRVLDVDARSAIGHVGLANVLFRQDRVAEALEHARTAVAIAPGYAQAHNDLGVGLARSGRLEEAVEHYRRALTLEPGNDEAHGNWGVVLARQGDLDGAVAQYRQALAANPDNADAHVNWGNALVRGGMPDEAVPHYREALRIRPDHADAEHNWGVALARSGKLAEAVEHFRRALAIEPGHGEARAYLDRAMQLLRAP